MLKDTNLQILEKNYEAVYSLFFEHEYLSKPQVAKLSGFSMPTVMSHIKRLEENSLIKKSRVLSAEIGRPATAYSLNTDAKVSIGVEIMSDKIKCAVFNLKAQAIAKKTFTLKCTYSPYYPKNLCHVLKDFMSELNLGKENVLGIGISLQAVVDSHGQNIIYSRILPISNLDINFLESELKLPCRLFHDVECAAINELWFSSDLGNAVFISLSEHIGGCLIKDHKIESGKCGYAGALEHIEIEEKGRLCYCGKQGCLETYCSISALKKDSQLDLKEFFSRLRDGGDRENKIWNDYLEHLSKALSTVYLLLERDIVLGGEMSSFLNSSDVLKLEELIKKRCTFQINGQFISIATVERDAAITGAALFFLSLALPENLVKVAF